MARNHDRPPLTLLEHLIWTRDLTYAEIRREYESVGRELERRNVTISDRHLRRLAHGEHSNTTPTTRRVLESMFSHPIDSLLGPVDRIGPDEPKPESAQTSYRRDREVLEMAMERARQFALMAGTNAVGDDVVEQIYDDVRELARSYPRIPVPQIIGTLADRQELVFSLLEQRLRPSHAHDLYVLAGVICGLLAKVSHDRADPHMAMTQARTAYVCATQADHNGLKAWIRGMQSLVAYWSGRPGEAVRYAQTGADFAQAAQSSMAVWLAASEARAWAAMGNSQNALHAVQRAEDAWDGVQGDDLDQIGGLCSFGRTRQLYYAADTLAWLPDQPKAAERYASQAVAAYADQNGPEWAFGDQAGSHADLAITRIWRNEIEGAAEAIQPVLEFPVDLRIYGVVQSAHRVHQALTRAQIGGRGSELQEQIETFTRTQLRELSR